MTERLKFYSIHVRYWIERVGHLGLHTKQAAQPCSSAECVLLHVGLGLCKVEWIMLGIIQTKSAGFAE